MVLPFTFNRQNSLENAGTGRDDFNLTLPELVRQLLQLTSSQYERDRAQRCGQYWSYYKNTMYNPDYLKVERNMDGNLVASSTELGAQLQAEKQLWAGIKPVFTIVPTSVDIDKRLCFKRARPLPIKNNAQLEQRLTAKWEQNRWRRHNKLSPLYGAVMGASYLRVIPGVLDGNPASPSRLGVYSPEIMTVFHDQHNHNRLLAAKIEYKYSESQMNPQEDIVGTLTNYLSIQTNMALGLTPGEQVHTYTMIITEEAYYTFRDHKLYAFDDVLGNSWANALGVVPIIEIPFNDIGEDIGLPTFASVLPQLDALNELMSMAGTILKNEADPILVAYGFSSKTKFEKVLQEDGSTLWKVPFRTAFATTQAQEQPRLEYLEIKGTALGALLSWVGEVKKDVEAAMPEMQLKAPARMSGSGHERLLAMQELVDKINEVRETHFDGVEDALQMALVADDVKGQQLTPDQAHARIEEARRKYDLYIWADTVLERDRASESQIISVNIADGLMSQHTGRLTYGMTYTQAIQEETLIDTEFEKELSRQRKWLELQKEFGVAPQMLPSARDLQMLGGQALSLGGKSGPNGTPAGSNGKATQSTKPGQPIRAVKASTASQPSTRPNAKPNG